MILSDKQKKPSQILYHGILTLTIFVFMWLSTLCLFEGSCFINLNSGFVLLSCFIALFCSLLLIFTLSFIEQKTALLQKKWVIFGLFFIYFLLQIQFALWFCPREEAGSWDFPEISYQAHQWAINGTPGNQYFSFYPNNRPYFLLLCLIFKPFVFFNIPLHYIGILFNILCINITVLCGYFVIKKLTSHYAPAFLYLFLSFVALPYLGYVSIYYTDTLTLPFPVAIYLIYLCLKDSFRKNNIKKQFIYSLAISFLAATGTLLKLSVSFMLIAIIMDWLFTFSIKNTWKPLCLLLLCFFGIYFLMQVICNSSPWIEPTDKSCYIPKSHWIMMGLNGCGSYNNDDYQLTLSVSVQDRDQFVNKEIIKRLQNYKLSGLLAHLHEKCRFTWTDGTFFTADKLNRHRIAPAPADSWLLYNGEHFLVTATWCQGSLLLYLSSIVFLPFLLLKGKYSDLFPCILSCLGLFFFFLIWEARSRYLLNYLPIILILLVSFINILSGILNSAKNRKHKKAL